MSNVTKIKINGVEYNNIEQMPPAVRADYLQALAALRESNSIETSEIVPGERLIHSVVKESFTFNGREYHSRDELPPEARALFDQVTQLSPDTKTNEVKIEMLKELPGEVRIIGKFGDVRPTAGNASNLPWTLVKVLVAVVVALLIVLGIMILRQKG